jgi:hypothetical protein
MGQTKFNLPMERLESSFLEIFERYGGEKVHTVFQRSGIFSAALTIWLMILQRINPRHALCSALEDLHNGKADQVLFKITRSKRVSEKSISWNSGGFSKARTRIQLEFVRGFVSFVIEFIVQRAGNKSFKEQRVFLLDGTTLALVRNPAILEKYPAGRNQNREIHNPEARIVTAHDLITGIAVCPEYGPITKGEQFLSRAVIDRLPPKSLILGDRNFGVFSVAFHATTAKHDVLIRLKKDRATKFMQGDKDTDHEVSWTPSRRDRETNPELPKNAAIKGKFIQVTLHKDGFQPLVLYFFTTASLTVEEVLELYKKREHIENDFRSIKHILNMEMIGAKSPAMVEKEILLGIAAYNLIRSIIAQAATQLNLTPRQISFSRSVEIIRIFYQKLTPVTTKEEYNQWIGRFLTALRQSQVYKRKRPPQPRKVIRRKTNFPLMKKSRAEEIQKLVH